MKNNYFDFPQLKKSVETRRHGDMTTLSTNKELRSNDLMTSSSSSRCLPYNLKSGDSKSVIQTFKFQHVEIKLKTLSPCIHVSDDNICLKNIREKIKKSKDSSKKYLIATSYFSSSKNL